jgi:NADH-dependent peroxiredoxin subunit F
MENNIYDTVIIGGGPAGVAAAVYAGRKKMKAMIIAETFGGQSAVSTVIENWIGETSISGFDLAKKLENHVRDQESLEVLSGIKVTEIQKENNIFTVKTDQDKEVETKTVIMATGGSHRKLGIPGEKEFDGKGVAYCSTCDAPMFSGKKVVVVGSGNSGLEAVIDLLPYAKSIYLVDILSAIRGDESLQQEIKTKINPEQDFHFLPKTGLKEIKGNVFVEKVILNNLDSGEEEELEAGGVFVEIGMIPNSNLVSDLVSLDDFRNIKIDHQNKTTSCPGIFAAGDVTDVPFKQNQISAGDGVVALLSAHDYLIKSGE